MFAVTIALFDEYYRAADASDEPGFIRDLGCEVRERLRQLNFIIERVRQLEADAGVVKSRILRSMHDHIEDLDRRGRSFAEEPPPPSATLTKEERDSLVANTFEMRLLTESFYYLASRVRTILTHKSKPLPRLSSFECKCVRDVRNHLLEHPEGRNSQVYVQSFGWGAPRGPVLKAIRRTDQKEVFPDQGLYRNADEFRVSLERVLKMALSTARPTNTPDGHASSGASLAGAPRR